MKRDQSIISNPFPSLLTLKCTPTPTLLIFPVVGVPPPPSLPFEPNGIVNDPTQPTHPHSSLELTSALAIGTSSSPSAPLPSGGITAFKSRRSIPSPALPSLRPLEWSNCSHKAFAAARGEAARADDWQGGAHHVDLCQLTQAARPGSSLHPSAVGLAFLHSMKKTALNPSSGHLASSSFSHS